MYGVCGVFDSIIWEYFHVNNIKICQNHIHIFSKKSIIRFGEKRKFRLGSKYAIIRLLTFLLVL